MLRLKTACATSYNLLTRTSLVASPPHKAARSISPIVHILEKESRKYLGISTNDYCISFFMGIAPLGIPAKPFTSTIGSDSSPAVTCVSSSYFLRPEAFLLLPFQYSGAVSMANLPVYPSCTLSAYKVLAVVVSMTTKTI